MSDEIRLLINTIISNQEQARARQESFETEIYKFFDTLDIELRGIRRHVDITEKELDRTIIRVERLEQASH